MTTVILCAGRLREKAFRQMADEYLKRLSRFGKYEEAEIPDVPEPAGASEAQREQVRRREGEAMLARVRPGDRVIALTITGRQRSSEDLAAHLADLKAAGCGRLVLAIGGSLGLSRDLLARADEELSMGPMTFPHQMARVMLLEQLYRAEKIQAGERYHK